MLTHLANIIAWLFEKDIVGYAAYGALIVLFLMMVAVVWEEMTGT